jgi:26S proteasome regulatory subunit T6
MYGPPGTGKTLLARAVAHHTDCTFIRISGAELVQKYIGEGARMVRELFVMAREAAPSIIFMDEVDSIGEKKRRGGRRQRWRAAASGPRVCLVPRRAF